MTEQAENIDVGDAIMKAAFLMEQMRVLVTLAREPDPDRIPFARIREIVEDSKFRWMRD